MSKYIIYCDGATSNNGSKDSYGGYGWVILNAKGEKLLEGGGFVDAATNNICELMAIIEACETVNMRMKENDKVQIYSDSAYCVNCYKQDWYKNWLENGWKNSKKQPVANKDLWLKLIPFFEDNRFTFVKAKGHSGDYWNEYVDKLAVKYKICI